MDPVAAEAVGSEPAVLRPEPPSTAGDVVVVLGSYLGLGVLAAVLWWLLVEPALFTAAPGGGLNMSEVQLTRRFSADGWYAVIAAVLGVASGAILTWWRSRDHLLTVGLLVVGAVLAAGVMALLGGLLGPIDPHTLSAEPGTVLPAALEVTVPACYLVWPIAALVGALVVLWSPPPDRPGGR